MSAMQPTGDQLRAFRDHPRAGPIQMVNLLKFREFADYGDGNSETGTLSGREAYRRYGSVVAEIVAGLGGRIVWAGTPEVVFIGDDQDLWDDVVVVEYPDRAAFLTMITLDEYQAAHVHRDAGLAYQKLIQCRPSGGAIS